MVCIHFGLFLFLCVFFVSLCFFFVPLVSSLFSPVSLSVVSLLLFVCTVCFLLFSSSSFLKRRRSLSLHTPLPPPPTPSRLHASSHNNSSTTSTPREPRLQVIRVPRDKSSNLLPPTAVFVTWHSFLTKWLIVHTINTSLLYQPSLLREISEAVVVITPLRPPR